MRLPSSGEPLDERGGVGDLALGFGQRLALLGGHQQARGRPGSRSSARTTCAGCWRVPSAALRAPAGSAALCRFDGAPRFRRAHFRNGADHRRRRPDW